MGRFTSLELEDTHASASSEEENLSFGLETKDAASFLKDAVAEFQLCNYEQALQLFSRVLSFDNGNAAAWLGQIRCLINMNEFKEASLWTDKATEVIGETANLLATKACALCRMGDFSRAYGFSDLSLEKKGTSSFVWLCRGEILLQQKRDNFDFCFEKAKGSQNAPWEILIEIARVYMFYNKNIVALRHLEEAKEIAPLKPIIWYELGNSYLNLGMKTNGINAFSYALELEPNMIMAKKRLRDAQSLGFWNKIKRKIYNIGK